MTNWFKRGGKVTAEAARRVTGISTAVFGVSWSDPGPSDADIVRKFLVFLEDRRVLYNPFNIEVEADVERSIHQIREKCTEIIQTLSASSEAAIPIRAIREAGRAFHDEQNEDFPHFDAGWQHRRGGPGFFMALGAYRASVGHQVAVLTARYDIDVEGGLTSIMPRLDDTDQLKPTGD